VLSPYDHAVIGGYFIYMAFIGWVCRTLIRNTSDYFRGSGRMLWWMAGWRAKATDADTGRWLATQG
jgi:Na+/proline symporter